MQLCLLKTAEIADPPEGVRTVANYGQETIVAPDDVARTHAVGDVLFVEGPADAIRKWLAPYDGVWVTLAPGTGDWQVVHVNTN